MEDVFLSRSTLLADITPDEARDLMGEAYRRAFAPGDVLFARGDSPDALYALLSGKVRVVIDSMKGDELTLATFGPGELLGELSVLDGTPRSATAVASGEGEALCIPAGRFRTWLLGRNRVTLSMLAELARRIRVTDQQIAEIALLDVESRISRRLWQAFLAAGNGALEPGTQLLINQQELASMLGVTRESVNKHLARLKAQGVIDVHRGILTLRAGDALRRYEDVL